MHQKIPHPCKFSEDKTSYNLEMVIKVHLLQKLLPAPKPLTSARKFEIYGPDSASKSVDTIL